MDIKTLLLCHLIVCAFFVIAFSIYSLEQKTYRGFKLWSFSALIMTLGFLALILRGLISNGVSIFFMHVFFTLAAVIRLDAINRFMVNKDLNKFVYSLPLLVGLFCIYFYYVDDQILLRSVMSSTAFSLFSLMLSYSLVRHAPPENRFLYYTAAGIVAVRCLTVLTRSWLGHFSNLNQLFDNNIWSAFQLVLGLICEISQHVFFLMMNSKRAESKFIEAQSKLNATVLDLKKALSEVKRLQGILPICGHCKKIRDDQGAWQGIEKYVHEHSAAKFSHGICPECAIIHYPEIDFSG